MSYENPRQSMPVFPSSQGKVFCTWGIAFGLCATALLLLGCTSDQVAADEGGRSREEESSTPDRPGDIELTDELTEAGDNTTPSLLNLAQVLPVAAEVELGGETIDLEVTNTQEEKATGLMYRASLAGDRGMLFRFSPAQPVRFWMKNVVINLDMVFVHEDKIVGIAADVPPCDSEPCATYSPGFGVVVDEVIELRGGRAAELGLAVGDDAVVQPLDESL